MNEMVGVPAESAARRMDDWWNCVHPDDRQRLQREIAEATQRLTMFETVLRVVWPDGSVRWLLPKGKIVRDEEGRPIRAAGVAMDITSRHQAEEERARLLRDAERREQELREKQAQLVQSAKLASLGELTTGVAHELNNPLNNINLILGNLIDQVHIHSIEREDLVLPLKLSMAQVLKASTIINHLRAFGRMAPMEREPISVNDVLTSTIDLMQEQLRLKEHRPDGDAVFLESLRARQPYTARAGVFESVDQCAGRCRLAPPKIDYSTKRRLRRDDRSSLSR